MKFDFVMELLVVWGASKFSVTVPATATLGELRQALFEQTNVDPANQKIMGLKGQPKDPGVLLSSVLVSKKLSLIGQPASVVSSLEKEAKMLEAQARREEEERVKREGALDRLRLMRQAEEERERARWAEERAVEERRYAEERRARMAEMRRDEQAEEMQADAATEFSLAVFSSVFAQNSRGAKESGDRMAMPPAVLQQLITGRIAMPCNFRVTCERTGKVCFCGVSEFNAPDGQAFSPHWFLEFLEAEEGETLRFETVTLPHATSVVLRPFSRNWQPLNQSDAGQGLLSEHLSKLSCLFPGQTVEIQSQRSLFRFAVLEVQPADLVAVSLLHADVELHLVDPIEADDAAPALSDRSETVGKVGAAGSFAYFFVLVRAGESIAVQVKPKDAARDVDVVASSTTRFPTSNDYELASVNSIGEKELVISGLRQDTVFVLGVTSNVAGIEFAMRLTQAQLQQSSGNNNNNDDSVCDNCKKPIPLSSLQLHSVRCRQLVHFCTLCHCSMPASVRAKHEAWMHESIVCGCGESLIRAHVPEHKRTCALRDERCGYCGLTLPAAELPEHRGSCGHKSAACTLCDFKGRRNAMALHCQKTHGVFEPRPTKEWTLE
jgi:hypothetical protein